jgi:hypothetical protein
MEMDGEKYPVSVHTTVWSQQMVYRIPRRDTTTSLTLKVLGSAGFK